MDKNPYAPPMAEVADRVTELPVSRRPRPVKIGVLLLWIAMAAGIPGAVVSFAPDPEFDSDMGRIALMVGVALMIFAFAVEALINWMAWRGRNWARIAHLVLTLISVVVYSTMPGALSQGLWIISDLLYAALNVVGVGLLFMPAANAWYREMKAALRARRAA